MEEMLIIWWSLFTYYCSIFIVFNWKLLKSTVKSPQLIHALQNRSVTLFGLLHSDFIHSLSKPLFNVLSIDFQKKTFLLVKFNFLPVIFMKSYLFCLQQYIAFLSASIKPKVWIFLICVLECTVYYLKSWFQNIGYLRCKGNYQCTFI